MYASAGFGEHWCIDDGRGGKECGVGVIFPACEDASERTQRNSKVYGFENSGSGAVSSTAIENKPKRAPRIQEMKNMGSV